MSTIINKINACALKALNRIQYPLLELVCHKRRLYLYCFSERIMFRTHRNNLGDDLNIDFIELISGRKVIKEEFGLLCHKERYSFIGSILEYVCMKPYPVMVWGTGFKFAHNNIQGYEIRKNKYLAVRGPLTRDLILKAGGDCPCIYGDPGILLSKFIKIERKITYKYGVIPHKTEYNLKVVQSLKERKDILLLDIVNYGSLQKFLNKMNSCEYIISSSLHGLIMADSYEIPNVWARFSQKVDGGGFKYEDYFQGAGKNANCVDLSKGFDEKAIMSEMQVWQKATVNKDFIEACPFKMVMS